MKLALDQGAQSKKASGKNNLTYQARKRGFEDAFLIFSDEFAVGKR